MSGEEEHTDVNNSEVENSEVEYREVENIEAENSEVQNSEVEKSAVDNKENENTQPGEKHIWTIAAIFDDDFGCEERQPGARLTYLVELKNEIGEKRTVRAYDEYLTWNRLEEGSVWNDPDEKSKKLFFKQKATLDTFLATGALTKDKYDFSLAGLIIKMGFDFDILNEEK